MGLNYKKAWTHIKMPQKNIENELIVPQRGGRGRGETPLTPKATELISTYRQLQSEIEDFVNRRFKELFFPHLSPAAK